jgi:cytochrome P450
MIKNPIPSKKDPPGPSGHWFFGTISEFRSDPLGFIRRSAVYGDVVKLRYGLAADLFMRRRGTAAYLLSDPADIKYVLATHQKNYERLWVPAAKRVFGSGLLASEDPLHMRQKRVMQPYFHQQRIKGYADVMVLKTEALMARWEDGTTVDLAEEMMRLTLQIVCNVLFSMELSDETEALRDAVTVGQYHITRQYRSFLSLVTPEFIPTRNNRAFRKAMQRLDETISGLIDLRRGGEEKPDLLSMLLHAQDEDGSGMSDPQLRDEVLTLFLAGHETTANAIAWTGYLLSQHPGVESALLAELREVLGGRSPSPADLPKLVYAEAVFSEAMRLYPPAYIVIRRALNDDTLPSGFTFPAGSDLFMCQYWVHRDPRFFPDPERFDPDRFLAETKDERPAFSYFPFGGGSKMCIGESFARMEGVLLLATMAQRFQMTLVPGQTIAPEPLVTLRPKNGVRVRLTRRGPGSEEQA